MSDHDSVRIELLKLQLKRIYSLIVGSECASGVQKLLNLTLCWTSFLSTFNYKQKTLKLFAFSEETFYFRNTTVQTVQPLSRTPLFIANLAQPKTAIFSAPRSPLRIDDACLFIDRWNRVEAQQVCLPKLRFLRAQHPIRTRHEA